MCLESEKIYAKDQEFLDEVKITLGLRSRAMALKWIFKKQKKLIKEELKEENLK